MSIGNLSWPPAIAQLFAPAKVNLYLHVLGLRDTEKSQQPGGVYHELDSLFAYADYGDRIQVFRGEEAFHPSSELSDPHSVLTLSGPFAQQLNAEAMSNNLLFKAYMAFCGAFLGNTDGQETKQGWTHRDLKGLSFNLEKNVPCGAGLGGGSSDAGAVLAWMAQQIDLPLDDPDLRSLALRLGSDVPASLHATAQRVTGIGERFEAIRLPPLSAVLIWPGTTLRTSDVFHAYDHRAATDPASLCASAFEDLPTCLNSALETLKYLRRCRNDLQQAACDLAPEIWHLLNELLEISQNWDVLVRMSGSGSSCFVLFPDSSLSTTDSRMQQIRLQKMVDQIQSPNQPFWVQWLRLT